MAVAALTRSPWPDAARMRRWYRAAYALPTRTVALWAFAVPAVPVAAMALAGGTLGTACGVILLLALGVATVTDLLWRRIFNWLVLATLAWVAGLHLLAPGASWCGLPAPAESLFGFAACLGLMLLLNLLCRGGEGDVKLLAAVGAAVGPSAGVEVLMFGYLLAAPVALLLLAGQKAGLRGARLRRGRCRWPRSSRSPPRCSRGCSAAWARDRSTRSGELRCDARRSGPARSPSTPSSARG